MNDKEKIGIRAKQREQRRAQILDCCLDAIVTKGYESMKIREIAETLGISTGLFFNYFASKEAVYAQLVQYALTGPQSMIALSGSVTEPIALFETMAHYILDALRTDSATGKYFLLMQQAMNPNSIPEAVRAAMQDFDSVTPLIPVILKGQACGQIRAGDPVALIMTFWSSIQGVAQLHTFYPSLPLPEAEWLVDIIRDHKK